MQTNKHWVFQTPEKFLTNYNSTQITQEQQHNSPTTIYTQLSVRVFLFFKGSILLCKRDNKWEIPEFGYTTGAADPLGKVPICAQTVGGLRSSGLPQDLIREIQFMDFSREKPLLRAFPKSNSSTHNELAISVILTTASAHLNLDNATASLTSLRWDTPGGLIDTFQQKQVNSLNTDVGPQDIQAAQQRLTDCSKPQLLTHLNAQELDQFCSNMLFGRIFTKALAERERNLGFGWIAITDDPSVLEWQIGLFPCNDAQEIERDGIIFMNSTMFRIVARWNLNNVWWGERIASWGPYMDVNGQLRAICSRKQERPGMWDVSYSEDILENCSDVDQEILGI